jgi:hypothetical protein
MMYSILPWLALSCGLFGSVLSAEPYAQLLSSNNDTLLKLDYATYRGHYNNSNEVISLASIQLETYLLGEL